MTRYDRPRRLTPAAIALRERATAPTFPSALAAPGARRYPEGAWPDPCDHRGFPVFGTRSYVWAVILGDYQRMSGDELARSYARYAGCEDRTDETGRICLAAMRAIAVTRLFGATS